MGAILALVGCGAVGPTPPAQPTFSRITAYEECRGGDAAACFALAYDHRSRGEATNEARAMRDGRALVAADCASSVTTSAPASADPEELVVASPKAVAPRGDGGPGDDERERAAYEDWMGNPTVPLAAVLDVRTMARTFGLDASFYEQHGVRVVNLALLRSSSAETMMGTLGFTTPHAYGLFLNRLSTDRAEALRRFHTWSERDGLQLPTGGVLAQERLSMKWTEAIQRHGRQLRDLGKK